jgi:hypothetical protein
MTLAIEKILVPATGHPSRPIAPETEQKLNIVVVFTSIESTLAALKEAGTLAHSLGAQIKLVVPQVVPYPLPLDSPPVLVEFNEPGGDERANLFVPRSLRNAGLGIETWLPCGSRRAEQMVAN